MQLMEAWYKFVYIKKKKATKLNNGLVPHQAQESHLGTAVAKTVWLHSKAVLALIKLQLARPSSVVRYSYLLLALAACLSHLCCFPACRKA